MRGSRSVLLGCSLLLLVACSVSGGSASDLGSDALEIEWANGTTTAFANLSSSSTSLQLNLTGASTETIEIDGSADNPNTINLAGTPTIIANPVSLTGGFVIGHNVAQTADTYNTFNDFLAALSQQITSTSSVLDVEAMGQYTSLSNQFSANGIMVLINN
jgi:uncharacterized protein involved in outer membrane biogenesis